MGYDFEPETVLSPCIYLVHQQKELYPEPKQFKPERFLERQFSPYEYFPFGGNRRWTFAQMEIKLVLATIISARFCLSSQSQFSSPCTSWHNLSIKFYKW